jgi:Putative esterase
LIINNVFCSLKYSKSLLLGLCKENYYLTYSSLLTDSYGYLQKLVSVFVKNSLHLLYQTATMKPYKFLFFFIATSFIFSCKSTVKQKEDSMYSRHLQRKMSITIISTKMPNKKEDMNLLLFSNSNLLEEVRAKKIIDSLVKEKLIQPLLLVAFEGNESDYGIEEAQVPEAKQYKKMNDFVINELLPYVKKHAVIRKFNSVAICGFQNAAISAFDIAWSNDEKIRKVGLFSPNFSMNTDDATFQLLRTSRKRPKLDFFISGKGFDSSEIKFKIIMNTKANITDCTLIQPNLNEAEMKTKPRMRNFAEFLVWAFSS